MPRRCTICARADRPLLDAAIAAGASIRQLAAEHGLPDTTLARHFRNHRSGASAACDASQGQDEPRRAGLEEPMGGCLVTKNEAGGLEAGRFDWLDGELSGAEVVRFLEKLSERGNLHTAASAIGVSRKRVERWRARSDDFDTDCRAALAVYADRLEDHLHDRIMANEKNSDILLMFRLKYLRPAYREAAPQVNVATVQTIDLASWRAAVKQVRQQPQLAAGQTS